MKTAFIFLALFYGTWLSAQDLREDEAFLKDTALVEFSTWLEESRLNQVLEVQKLVVNPNQLEVYLSSPLSDKSLIASWDSLQTYFYKNYEKTLQDYLFEQLCFQLEVEKEQLLIFIVGKKPNFFWVKLFYENYGVQNDERILRSMGKGKKSIVVRDLKKIYKNAKDSKKGNIKAIKEKMLNYLINYYEGKGTFIGHKADTKVIDESYNEFTFDVWNLSYEVVDDGYFEYIHWEIALKQEKDKVIIEYDLKAKYGSGFFYAPRKNGYKMRDSDLVEDYQKEIINKVRKQLTK